MPTQEQIDALYDAAWDGDLGRVRALLRSTAGAEEGLSAFAGDLEAGAYLYEEGEGLVPR